MSAVVGFNSIFYGTSTKELAISAAFAVVFAFLGYRISVRHRMVRGVTPWRLPSYVWAIICGVFQAFGIILELIAEVTTRPQPRPSPTPGAAADPGRPSFPFAANATVTSTEAVPPIEIAPAPSRPGFAPPNDGSGQAPLFGWYPDPTKRHELRYWDGRHWSEQVADSGAVTSDPI